MKALIKKKAALSLLLALSCFAVQAQKLTIQELMTLCGQPNWDNVNQMVVGRGWAYYESKKGDKEGYSTITWSYNKEDYSEKASGWLYCYATDDRPAMITLNIFDRGDYSSIQMGIQPAGFKLSSNKIEDDKVISTYSSDRFLLMVEVEKRPRSDEEYASVSAYTFSIVRKSGVYDPNNGPKKSYYDNGTIQSEYTVVDGELNGPIKAYYESGELKKTGNYKNGKGNGYFIEYEENGSKIKEYTLVDDTINGRAIYYENGTISSIRNFKHGVADGISVLYNYDRKKTLQTIMYCPYKNDLENGLLYSMSVENGKEVDTIAYGTYINGIEEGPFKQYFGKDSLIIGTKKNGLIHGHCEIRTNTEMTIGDSKIKVFVRDSEGEYYNGKKSGKWIKYMYDEKMGEGYYTADKRSGLWNWYCLYGKNKGKVMFKSNYLNGEMNGLLETFFQYNTVNGSDQDSISNYEYIPCHNKEYFKNNELDGEAVYADSNDVILRKGRYVMGKKEGVWIEGYMETLRDSTSRIVYFEGSYQNDKETGLWKRFTAKDSILGEYTFKDGLLDGKFVNYNNDGSIDRAGVYLHGHLLYVHYPQPATFISDVAYQTIKMTDKGAYFRQTKSYPDSSRSYEFYSDNDENQNLFIETNSHLIQWLAVEESNTSSMYLSGQTILLNAQNEPLLVGHFDHGIQDSLWTKYDYSQDVKYSWTYNHTTPTPEHYYSLHNTDYNGDLIVVDKENKVKEVRRIRNGFRNGKTIYYDLETDKVIRKESYEDGVLKP